MTRLVTSLRRWPIRLCVFLGLSLGALRASAFTPDWSTYPDPFYPLTPATPNNPVLTAADVTDMTAYLVADPFLMRKDGLWLMFFEASWNIGAIGYATSGDGLTWQYQHLVLSEPFHLSFPCVFEDQGEYYMIPESGADQSIRLYRAAAFPEGWGYVTTLVSGQAFADPTIFKANGLWWMFVSTAGSDRLYLYYSETLTYNWRQHPLSPIVTGDRSKARPAGRVVLSAGGQILRLAQKCDAHYGQAVRAFAIDRLSTTEYAEHEIAQSPILQGSGSGWNKDGMHTCDPWWDGDHWLAAVDGASNGPWSIGIYRSPTYPSAGLESPSFSDGSRTLRLVARPDPFREEVILAWTSSGGQPGAATLSLYDAGGRLARVLEAPSEGGREITVRWDGRMSSGIPAPSGSYFCRLTAGGRTGSQRIERIQ